MVTALKLVVHCHLWLFVFVVWLFEELISTIWARVARGRTRMYPGFETATTVAVIAFGLHAWRS